MNITPKVSVVLPVYNVAKYLEQCVNSLLTQTLRDVEFIFVNDGSTDNSLEILDAYAAIDDRVRVISQKNCGAAIARNNGIALATGEYLAVLDPDDYFAPSLLEDSFNCAMENNADLVIFSEYTVDDNNGKIFAPEEQRMFRLPDGVFAPEVVADFFMSVVPSASWPMLYRRKFIIDEKIKFQNLKRANDQYFSFMAFLLAPLSKFLKINKSESLNLETV